MTLYTSEITLEPHANLNIGEVAAVAWSIVGSQLVGSDNVTLKTCQLAGVHSQKLDADIEISMDRKRTLRDLFSEFGKYATVVNYQPNWSLSVELPLIDISMTSSILKVAVIDTSRSCDDKNKSKKNTDCAFPLIQKEAKVTCLASAALQTNTFTLQLLANDMEIILKAPGLQRVWYQVVHLVRMILATEPSECVNSLELLMGDDFESIQAWNENMPPVEESCVHELIVSEARKRPSSPAICSWDGDISYYELNQISSKLAQHLISLGVKAEVMVPFCFEKSIWAIISMLAILKAGGACVPLDPSHPRERRQTILDDLSAHVVLVSQNHLHLFEKISVKKVTVNKSFLDTLESTPIHLDVTCNPNNAVFVVFTSGSTGQPKGIIIEHKAICTSARHHGKIMGFNEATRALQFAAFTYDDSFSDIFTTLIHGGCVCIPSDTERLNDLPAAIKRTRANQACLTTTVAKQLRPSDNPSLKTLAVGGEAVTEGLLQQWAPYTNLINAYGPAECSIFCSGAAGLRRGDDARNVGFAWGCRLWITDATDHDRLLPIGAVGELLVEGPILARGYLNNKTKTESSFIQDPKWIRDRPSREGRRFYKTGDLARYCIDGSIQILGRKDTQVKLRGQRIELGEIEHQIQQHYKDSKSVTVELSRPQNGAGAPALVAFLETDTGSILEDQLTTDSVASIRQNSQEKFSDLRENLMNTLPKYMVPTLFVSLCNVPTTVSGKTDRKVLKQIASQILAINPTRSTDPASLGMQPVTTNEKLLQSSWSQVLNIPSGLIDTASNFLLLGGDSVGAMALVADMRRAGYALTVQAILQNPRLDEQALSVKELDSRAIKQVPPFSLIDASEDLDRLRQMIKEQYHIFQNIENIYPLTPQQEDLVSLSIERSGAYIARMVYSVPSSLNIDQFKLSWNTVIAQTPLLRTRFVPGTKFKVLQVVLTHEPETWIEGCALDSYLAWDSKIPMEYGSKTNRFALIHDTKNGLRWFVLTAHQATFDAWSMQKMLRAVEAHYSGSALEETPLLTSFIQHLQELDNSKMQQFWRDQLEPLPLPSFPTSASLDINPQPDKSLARKIPFTQSLRSGTTLSTILRATWALVVSKQSQSDDIVFACRVSGRNAPLPGIETIVGPTITTLPIRVNIKTETSVKTFLGQMQDLSVATIPFEQMGLHNICKMIPGMQIPQSLLIVQFPTSSVHGSSFLGLNEAESQPFENFFTYTLHIECQQIPDAVSIDVKYDSRIIETARMERALDQFERIFEALTDKSTDMRLCDINIPHLN